MPKLVYTAAKGLVQEAGSGINVESTDGTCVTNAATIDGTSGVITLVAATIADGELGTVQTITNGSVTATSTILLDVDEHGESAPVPLLQSVSAGSFTFRLGNVHGATDITSAVKISYLVL
jgi:hypothetical protein